jgi:hypothetical protein
MSSGDEQGIDWEGQVSEKDVGDHPVNRAGRPKDIADAALWYVPQHGPDTVTDRCKGLWMLAS